MADFIDSSNPAIQTSRKFPAGCGPDAPKTGAAFKWLIQTPNLSTSPNRKRALAGNSSGSSRQLVSALNNPILGGDGSREVANLGGDGDRERVLGLLKIFRRKCKELLRSGVEITRVDLRVLTALREEQSAVLKLSNQRARSIGAVPGVEVEDRFECRAEMVIVGLHRQLQNGIDAVEYRGRRVASCVVATEGHYDKMNDPDVLVYGGEGGGSGSKGSAKWKRKPDQVMKGGNLAMKNSIEVRNEVRVVRGLKVSWKGRNDKVVYVYDGLYEVVGWKTKTGSEGNMVFDFEMRRKPGQPRINWKNHIYI